MTSIDQLKSAVENASSEARAAYVSFTIFALYFAITVGAASHEALLRGSEVTMPALGVGLPIVGFFVLVPPLFLLFHALLLIQLNVLASRVRRLKTATADPEDRAGPPFVLSQLLLGNIRGFLLRPMVYVAMWVSLILLPVGVLVFVQVRFLPYHSDWVTSWHRILIVVDLILVWLLWPQILRPAPSTNVAAAIPDDQRPSDRREDFARGRSMAWRGLGLIGLVVLTAVTLSFSWMLATIPETPAELAQMPERDAVCPADDQDLLQADAAMPPPAYETCRPTWRLWSYFTPVSLSPAVAGGPVRTVSCLSYLLFEAPTTPLNMRRNLQVRSTDLVQAPPRGLGTERLDPDRAWLDHGLGLDLRGRDLRYADLSSSDLRKADLRGADLLGANLVFADLRYARAGHVKLSDFDGCQAELQADGLCLNRLSSANLQNADLRSSRFRGADLRQANLNFANLQGVDLASARLDHASLQGSSLEGAELHSAVLDRADLKRARLAGSDLSEASLQHTCLESADMTLAHLKRARLAHADLSQARLDGAFLPEADLTGAMLTKAYLAGADLRRTRLDRITIGQGGGEAFFGWSDMRGIDERSLETLFASALERAYGSRLRDVPFHVLKSAGEKGSGSSLWADFGDKYDGTLKAMLGSVRHDLATGVLPMADPQRYELDLASLLAGKACRADVSPFVVRSLIRRMVDDIHTGGEYRPHHQKVAYRLLSQLVGTNGPLDRGDGTLAESSLPERSGARCPPAVDLPEDMRTNLRAIMVLLL